MITNQALDSLVSEDDTTNKTVCDILLEKHLPLQLLVPSAIYEVGSTILEPHLNVSDQIDG